MLDIEGFYKAPKSKLPKKLKSPDLEKFDGIENPKSHLNRFQAYKVEK